MNCRICDRKMVLENRPLVCQECLGSREPLVEELTSLKMMIGTQCKTNLLSITSIKNAMSLSDRTEKINEAIVHLLEQMIKTNTLVLSITSNGTSRPTYDDPDQKDMFNRGEE